MRKGARADIWVQTAEYGGIKPRQFRRNPAHLDLQDAWAFSGVEFEFENANTKALVKSWPASGSDPRQPIRGVGIQSIGGFDDSQKVCHILLKTRNTIRLSDGARQQALDYLRFAHNLAS